MTSARIDFDAAGARAKIDSKARRMRKKIDGIAVEAQDHLRNRITYLAPYRTGELVGGVFVDIWIRSGGPVLVAGVHGVPHAVFVEFGTKDTAAEPFVRPALAEMPGYIKRLGR